MHPTRRLWQGLAVVFVLSFAALLWLGREIYLAAPPIPDSVRTASGELLYTGEQIQDGQRAWRAAGGQQLGTVWGHGSYVAPDWSADWLHREALAYRDILASRLHGEKYEYLTATQRGAIDAAVRERMRENTYDASSKTLTIPAERARAIAQVERHYMALFGTAPQLDALRGQYAMTTNALPRVEDRKALSAFFFWSAWSASTDRPGESGLSYTSNWPHEPAVGNTLTSTSMMWS